MKKVTDQVNKYVKLLKKVGLTDMDLMGSFIAGGAIRSVVLDESVKDVDIFCHNQEVINNILVNLEKRNQKELDNILEIPYSFLSVSENAISFVVEGIQFQIIKVKTGQPLEVIGEFDFEMNMNYVELVDTNHVYIHNKAAVEGKVLTINPKCRNKLGTLARLEKFIKRGYTTGTRNNLLMLGVQLSQLDPVKDFKQLEEESRLYFTFEEYSEVDFVEKNEGSTFVSKYVGSAF